MRRERVSVGLLLAVAASVGLHLGLAQWVYAQKPIAPQQLTSSVELVEYNPPPPPVAAPEEPPRPTPPEPKPRPRAAVAPPPPTRPPPTPTPVAVEPPVDPVIDRPTRTQDLALPTDTPSLRLLPSAAFALSLDAGVLPVDEEPHGLHAPERPADLVAAITQETIGRGRVERGLVHPYYSQLGKALVKQWDADRVVAQGNLKNWADQVGQNTRAFGDIWLNRASEYAKTGSPVDSDGRGDGRRPAPIDGVGGLPGIDLNARREVQRQLREQFKATKRATIRVVQDREGKLVKLELVEASTDAAVDKEAMKDVRAAAEKLPKPPDDALGARERISSLWSFELTVSISPPVPTFTFEFDEVVGTIDPRLPLDRRVYKRVRLVSVE